MGAGASNLDQAHPVLCGCTTCRAAAGPESAPTAAAAGSGAPLTAAMSGTFYIDALLPPDNFRWNFNAPGTPLTITYGFMTTMPWYSSSFGYESGPFQAFTAAQQEGVHRAIALFEQIASVDFVFRPDGDNAQIRFGSADLGDFEAAHTYYPELSGDWAGDVWFNVYDSDVYNQSAGTYGFMVTLHEIGHALGLKHSFNDGSTFSPVLPADKDNRQYTVMSYNDPASTPSLEPASPMLYDIAALQYLYGANTSYKSGNDTWRWNPNETFLWAIWDGGGIDTLDASNQTRRVILDLTPGSFSSLGSYNGGDALNNLAIAYSAWIENAIGGSGNDTITGNQLNNRIDGGGGNDTITGGDGDDTLLGGAGDDTFYADFGADSFDGGSGFDTVIYGSGIASGVAINLANPSAGSSQGQGDTFVSIEKIVGTYYDDSFVGDANANWFVGGEGNDTFEGGAGADSFDGGNGTNTLSYAHSSAGVSVNLLDNTFSGGDAAGDKITSYYDYAGSTWFSTTIQNVIGSAYDDVLIGVGSFSYLFGGDGNDTLSIAPNGNGGGRLAGGAGNDVYLTGTNFYAYIEEAAGGGYDEVRASGNIELFGGGEVEKITFVGTGGFRAWGSSYAQTIIGGAGDDSIEGRGGSDTLIGNGGNDTLVGNAASDTLLGGDGNDTLDGGRGADVLSGGNGDDRIYYYGDTTGVTIDGGAGFDTLDYKGFGQTIDLQTAMFAGIERVNGSIEYADTLLGNAADNVFYGGGGNDYIDGRGGYDTAVYIGSANEYDVVTVNGVTTIKARRAGLSGEGVDTLVSIENIQFTGEAVNHAPTVNLFPQPVGRNTTPMLMDFFGVYDADEYTPFFEIRELTAGAGYMTLDGAVVPVGQSTGFLTRSDYYRLVYHASTAADQFEVRGFDGILYSDWTKFTLTPTNTPPLFTLSSPLTSGMPTPHATAVYAITDLMTFSDPNGDPILRYRFWDGTPGNGYFRVNGVAQATGQIIEVTQDQLASIDFVVATAYGGYDMIQYQGYDGIDWSFAGAGWLYARANGLPTIAASSTIVPSHGPAIAASSMFTVADADGDPITQYEFRDNTSGNGYFRLNGVQQAANFQIADGQLSSLQFVPGTGGTDQIEVRAFDGLGWGSWTAITVAAMPNALPVVTANNVTAAHGQSFITALSLFGATDADGDTITQFEIRDNTAGGGYFRLNGVQQAASFQMAASERANLHFVPSTTMGNQDHIEIRAFDGYAWGDWKAFTVGAAPNAAPTVRASGAIPGRSEAFVGAASLIIVSDSDGDTMARYRFFDGTTGNGRFLLSGTAQAENVNIEVTAAQLANLNFAFGAPGTTDTVWAQVFDGLSWSTWTSFTVTAPQNSAPVTSINTASLNPTKGTATIAASSFFTATDNDGDAITQYRFFDGTTGSGRFELNGVQQVEQANITVNAADLANFRFRVGAGSDVLWVQAYDGAVWGAWKSFTVAAPANVAPTVNVVPLNPLKSTTFIAGSALFTVTDPDDAAMTKYRFFDGNTGNGRFQLNGVDQAELANIEINASDLANFRYRTSTSGAGDLLWVQAYDGAAWSAWQSFMVTAPVNVAPTVNVQPLNPAKSTAFIAGSALFTVTDPDDASMAKYRFFDSNTGNGRFQLNGVDQAEAANIEINAADLANFRYRTSTTGAGDLLWVQAFDGFAWGAWKSFMVNAPVNVAPTVNVQTLNPSKSTSFITAANLFTVTDPDDATVARLRFFDGNTGNGRFQLNGIDQVELSNIEIAAADLANLRFRLGGGSDLLWVQAYDGFAWSTWKSFTVNAPVNAAPTVFVEDLVYGDNAVLDASTLFVVNDPDDATMVSYRFWDSEANSGYFRLNGVALQQQRNVEIAAADLANLDYIGVGYSRDTIWVQAFDGTAWSQWKTFEARAWSYGSSYTSGITVTLINPVLNEPPAVTVTNTNAQSGSAVSIGSLVSATDPEGDAITAWRFYDTTAGRGTLRLNGVAQADGSQIEVMASQLAAAEFLAGTTAGFNKITASAFDGNSWSDPKLFIINTLVPS